MDAGPFYVIPESHKEGPFFNSNCKKDMVTTMNTLQNSENMKSKIKINKPMLVKKGDIVICRNNGSWCVKCKK